MIIPYPIFLILVNPRFHQSATSEGILLGIGLLASSPVSALAGSPLNITFSPALKTPRFLAVVLW